MLRKLIFVGLFVCLTASLSAQYGGSILDSIDTPPDVQENYDLLLSNKEVDLSGINPYSDESVLYHDSVYIKRLHSLPTKMELVFNQAVKNEIEKYATTRKNQVSFMLGEAQYYFPIFEDVLDREGLPIELKYLPIIESALRPVARSRVGASGLWQFMAATAKMYGLEVNSLVDERYDVHKSTEAAAKFIKDLYAEYKDWNLVIAAYNCGIGRVNRAIARSGGQTDYWAIYPHLPKETRGYVPIFIAATYIMNYYREHNITPSETKMPFYLDSIVVNKSVHFDQIASVLNISVEDIKNYNPQFKTNIIPGDFKGYTLVLPAKQLTAFIEKEQDIYAYRRDELLRHRKVAGLNVVGGAPLGSKTLTHRVKRGDTLARLANQYGVSSSQIKEWNNLTSNKLSVGRQLRIYKPNEDSSKELLASDISNAVSDTIIVSSTGLTRTVTIPKVVTSYYKIKRGDTWAGIAKKNNTSIAELKQWNNVKSDKLIAGKQLKMEKVVYEEIQQTIKLEEPQLSVVLIDSAYCAGLIDRYLAKIERDESSLPLIRIASTDSNDEQVHGRISDEKKIIYHKVKIGETITQIAARYNVSKDDIVVWNRLSANMAKVGQRLLIYLPDSKDNAIVKNKDVSTSTNSFADKD